MPSAKPSRSSWRDERPPPRPRDAVSAGADPADGHDGGNDELVSVETLERWLGDLLPGDAPLRVDRVTSGHSNELFTLTRGAEVWMLRRPPRVPNAPTAHDMAPEFRVLTALERT